MITKCHRYVKQNIKTYRIETLINYKKLKTLINDRIENHQIANLLLITKFCTIDLVHHSSPTMNPPQ
jgi:hypothetical protein